MWGRKRYRYVLFAGSLVLASVMGFARIDYAYADECPAGGKHAYAVTILVPATENADGLKSFLCTQCGYTFEKTVAATGHAWGPWITDLEPTCISEGHAYRVCERYASNPHYEEQTIPPLSPTGEHEYVLISEVLATCDEGGYRHCACEKCGAGYEEELAALGHQWGEWIVEQDPVATEEGLRVRRCVHDAAHVEQEILPALGKEQKEEPEEPKVQVIKPDKNHVVPEAGFDSGFFSFKPTTFDAAFLALDGVLIVIVIYFIVPFLARVIWTKKRSKEAFQTYLEKTKKEIR